MTAKRILGLLFALALLAWLFSDQRWQGVSDTLARLPMQTWVIALLGMALSYTLRAVRVYEEFRTPHEHRFLTCLRIVLIHNALVNVMPFRSGEAAFPMLLRQNFGTPLTRAMASLFWFRLQDALIVALLAIGIWPNLPFWLRGLGIFMLLVLAIALPRWAHTPPAQTAQSARWQHQLQKVRTALAESTQHARYGWVWTIANWTIKLAVQAYLLSALVPTTHRIGAAGALGAELAAILPIQGIAGFGTYEAGAAAAMRLHAIPLETGLQAALALHLFMIASAVSAGALATMLHQRRNTPNKSL